MREARNVEAKWFRRQARGGAIWLFADLPDIDLELVDSRCMTGVCSSSSTFRLSAERRQPVGAKCD